jgi:hypothetical protein
VLDIFARSQFEIIHKWGDIPLSIQFSQLNERKEIMVGAPHLVLSPFTPETRNKMNKK